MSNWDEALFADTILLEFLEDLQDEYDNVGMPATLGMLEDAVVIAQKQSARGEEEFQIGLLAASIAAIWCGAPYSASEIADDNPVLRQGIGSCNESLQKLAGELLETEFEALEADGEEPLEGLETYIEALS